MNLGRGFDEILEMSPSEEVAERDEFAVVFVLNVDHTPSVLAASNRSPSDDNRVLGSDHRKRDEVLDVGISSALLLVLLIIIIGVHS